MIIGYYKVDLSKTKLGVPAGSDAAPVTENYYANSEATNSEAAKIF